MEIVNRKARYDYFIEDEIEAGMVLTGTEIKSIRAGKANIGDSYAIIRKNEIYLLNAHISEYTEGNRVKTIKFGNHELSGVETRTLLGLKSTNFEFYKNDNNITFIVKGYGHGVGMSQTGADSMAKDGASFEDIIHHFYSNVSIGKL